MKIFKYLNIILILVWIVVIFLFSAQDGEKSYAQSNEVIIKTAETIKKEQLTETEKNNLIKKYIVLVRKSAHFLLYFVLSILIYLFVIQFKGVNYKSIIITLSSCLIYAITDEIHQLFSAGRTAKIFDIAVDTTGAILGTLLVTTIYYIILKIKKSKQTKKDSTK